METPNPFKNIGFEDFRRLATDRTLSKYERIGFPDSYRKGFEPVIFADILEKLPNLLGDEKCVVDIGPGSSDLTLMMIELCLKQGHGLVCIDSQEMLDLLPNEPFIDKVAALFPNSPEMIERYRETADVIICYSVLHYVFVDTSLFRFLDIALSLLAPHGQFLIGDIPNVSKRKRFFSSETGVRFHKEFMKTDEQPKVEFNRIEHDHIDDAVLMALIQRARGQGFDAYILPQNPKLPMANRREDILIVRP